MDRFECPSVEIWNARETWIQEEIEKAETGCYMVSDHSTALFMDMRLAYCAGAWLSVIVMSVSVIDAHLRETEADNNEIGTAKLFNEFYFGESEEINWLRQLRNKYVHHNLEKPILGMNAFFNDYEEMEKNATKAMLICIKAFFQTPGV